MPLTIRELLTEPYPPTWAADQKRARELAERVEAVLKLHKPIRRTRRTATDSFNWRCPACSTYFRTEHEGCSTIRALEGQS